MRRLVRVLSPFRALIAIKVCGVLVGKGYLMFEGWLRIHAKEYSALAVLIGVVMTFLSTFGTAHAQSGILVGVDEARVVPLVSAPTTVIVGNPGIADVAIQSGDRLIVMGKNYGTTNVIAMNGAGEEIANLEVNVTTSGRFEVSLHKGSARTTYNCAPMCEEELNIGDGIVQFDKIVKQTTGKMGIADSSAQPSENSE